MTSSTHLQSDSTAMTPNSPPSCSGLCCALGHAVHESFTFPHGFQFPSLAIRFISPVPLFSCHTGWVAAEDSADYAVGSGAAMPDALYVCSAHHCCAAAFESDTVWQKMPLKHVGVPRNTSTASCHHTAMICAHFHGHTPCKTCRERKGISNKKPMLHSPTHNNTDAAFLSFHSSRALLASACGCTTNRSGSSIKI